MSGASSGRGLRKSNRAVLKVSGGIISDSGIRNVSASSRLEKTLKKGSALLRQDAGGDLAMMIQAGQLEQINSSAGRATPRIRAAEDDAPDPDVDQRASTHRARFFRDVKIAIVQPPVADSRFRLCNREHLGVRGRILEHLNLVKGAGDDPAVANNDGADRDFFLLERFPGETNGFAHERFICWLIDKVLHAKRCLTTRLPDYTANLLRPVELIISMKIFSALLALCFLPFAAANAATEQEVVNQSARILRDFHRMPEQGIPESVLRNAKGVAVLTVVKIGFGISGKGGQGVVVARTGHGFSGPSFIGTGGAGWGPQIGAQITEYVFVLNTNRAVRAFSRDGNFTVGADASAAAGPVGREAAAAVTPTAAIYTYSRAKGLFAGVSLEGSVLATQNTANTRYYGRPVSAREILSGSVAAPPRAGVLETALER